MCCYVDCTVDDMEYFRTTDDPDKLDEHLSYMISDSKRNTEVSIKWLSEADRAKFEAAQSKEMDQWVDNAVFSIARRAGVPTERIMTDALHPYLEGRSR